MQVVKRNGNKAERDLFEGVSENEDQTHRDQAATSRTLFSPQNTLNSTPSATNLKSQRKRRPRIAIGEGIAKAKFEEHKISFREASREFEVGEFILDRGGCPVHLSAFQPIIINNFHRMDLHLRQRTLRPSQEFIEWGEPRGGPTISRIREVKTLDTLLVAGRLGYIDSRG